MRLFPKIHKYKLYKFSLEYVPPKYITNHISFAFFSKQMWFKYSEGITISYL